MHVPPPGQLNAWPAIYPSGLDAALRRHVRIKVDSSWSSDLVRPLRIGVTSSFPVIVPPAVRGMVFPPPAGMIAQQAAPLSSPRKGSVPTPPALATQGSTRSTQPARVRPPADVIKLSDRLYYLLQPPLESLVSSEALTMPFQPFPFQWDGIAFLYPRVAAILADEMGLGKTMQAITAIRMLLHAGEIKTVLMVCPKPLVPNWQREFAAWAGELPLVVIEGSQEKRQWQWLDVAAPVKLANYEVVLRDHAFLARDAAFDLVVLDEAQRVKNRGSATSKAVRSIRRSRSWALTGTPVENRAEDLLGIFEFLSPGYLSPQLSPRSMGRAAGDYILRRTKCSVLQDLPPKLIREACVELSRNQRTAYELAESQGVVRLAELGAELTVHHVFELVLRLKQICNFDPLTGESTKRDRLLSDMEEIAASGQKALVFSQWVRSLERLKEVLAEFHPLEFHGQVSPKQREGVLREFQHNPQRHVLLMTYGAGSVGLNLQFASYVFLFDRWWNPAVEDQAINRAHRIGACGPVTVTRFLTVNTIEERIHEILQEKRQLFDTILAQTHQAGRMGLSQKEIFGLFRLPEPAAGRAAG